MIQLKSAREIETMAAGGVILAATHAMLRNEVKAGLSTADLDAVADDFIRSHDGALPAFKGLYGFPASLCISVNEEVVHGIPSAERRLVAGQAEGRVSQYASLPPIAGLVRWTRVPVAGWASVAKLQYRDLKTKH